jgi:hypothetical protein
VLAARRREVPETAHERTLAPPTRANAAVPGVDGSPFVDRVPAARSNRLAFVSDDRSPGAPGGGRTNGARHDTSNPTVYWAVAYHPR